MDNNNNNRSPDTNSLCDLGQVTTYLNLIFYLSNRSKNPLCQAQLSLRIKINKEAYWKNANKYYYLLWIYMVKSLRHQARLIHALSPSSWALGSRPAGPTKTMQLMDTTPGGRDINLESTWLWRTMISGCLVHSHWNCHMRNKHLCSSGYCGTRFLCYSSLP